LAKDNHSSSAVYGLGFIGAAIYFIIWPAFLVYEALKSLGA